VNADAGAGAYPDALALPFLLFLFVNLPQVSALFLRELEFSPLPVLRNNLLIILTDICVRYTSLVDPHINKLALCLRDDNALVRQHALSLITHLLATDYVKWRGTLFFRYLVTLVLSSTLSCFPCLSPPVHPSRSISRLPQ